MSNELILALVVMAAVGILWGQWKFAEDEERVVRSNAMTRPWQIAALIVAVIFGIPGFLAFWGDSRSKPGLAFAAVWIIGYLVVWFVYLVAKRLRRIA